MPFWQAAAQALPQPIPACGLKISRPGDTLAQLDLNLCPGDPHAMSKPDPRQLIRVGHSPDPDDAFMFHALANGKIDTGPFRFEHQLQDIQTLNERARRGELEVTAISIHAYPYVADRYAMLNCGSSMGDGYGPMVVSREPMMLADVRTKKLAIPGELTTAFLALQLAVGTGLDYDVVMFDQIIPAVASGQYDAGLIIHEGQLTYADAGLRLVADLGVWWGEATGFPLPLGGNVIRRDLGEAKIATLSVLLKQSIEYALANRDEAVVYALQYARDMGKELADEFVGMYVNDWTLDYGDRGRAAVNELLRRAHAAGLVPKAYPVTFV
ncbi:MAG: 1,4-dihydroxy-6-naphtoate synthase [Phycisphaerae bacterium]|nr:1,4-dihydroxy-6-naphtoate synthase [Phycisphaerae bacterium]